jgi:hypothetical protein
MGRIKPPACVYSIVYLFLSQSDFILLLQLSDENMCVCFYRLQLSQIWGNDCYLATLSG